MDRGQGRGSRGEAGMMKSMSKSTACAVQGEGGLTKLTKDRLHVWGLALLSEVMQQQP